MNNHYKPDHDVLEVIQQRWSPYVFSSRPVERTKLQKLFEAARFAASSYNEQPWRYIIACKSDERAFNKLLACLVVGNQGWAKHAQVLGLSFAKNTFEQNGEINRCAQHDVGAASAFMALQATALGLQVHQMGGIELDKIITEYNVPENFSPIAGFAIGYHGANDAASDELKVRDNETKSRKTLAETCFQSTWDEPFFV